MPQLSILVLPRRVNNRRVYKSWSIAESIHTTIAESMSIHTTPNSIQGLFKLCEKKRMWHLL